MRRFSCLFIILIMMISAQAETDRDALRASWRAIRTVPPSSLYEQLPSTEAPLSAGALTDEALENALDTVNFLRKLAGLDPVSLSPLYTLECQHGAALLAHVDYAAHDLPKPEGVSEEFYQTAVQATRNANVARFNWTRESLLEEAILYFARDDGEANLNELGHRRWLLDPAMRETGFGLADSDGGNSYALMYATDMADAGKAWDHVAWPSAGCFPVELMRSHLPWSISLNEDIYDVASSDMTVTLLEETTGLSFSFDCASPEGEGLVSFDRCGSGPAVIFRPDFTSTSFTDYLQNQVWTVRLTGLKTTDGEESVIEYTVDMVSLYAQDVVSVEMKTADLSMKVGEEARLNAQALPSYADDLTLTWTSSDERVAKVDADGRVTAFSAGTAIITAASANGRSDSCAVTVK